LTADDPVKYGGTGKGPSSFGLMSAALASCTTMTLRMYAERKKLDLRSSTVRVSHAKIHAEECADGESTGGKNDEFQREQLLYGNLTAQERQRLLEIADMCPIHHAFHAEVTVRTTAR
jgi:uncharacterized OsmC-like protein